MGGTFTDLVGVVEGRLTAVKVPSTPDDQSRGVADALTRSGVKGPLLLAHGMTVATNALLERRGARTALVTTEGFRDLIEIARQDRADLYDLSCRRPAPLVDRTLRFTVRERVGPQGVIIPLDEDSVEKCVAQLADAGVDAVAVCLLFAFRDPAHERAVGEAVRAALPGVHVSLSSDVLPEFREYERLSTTVADAYLAPEMTHYLSRLVGRVKTLGVERTLVMQSSGGVASVEDAARLPVSCVLSGPAGGVVGARTLAHASGYEDVLTLDIGGTSADVAAIIGGELSVTTERSAAGVAIGLPMLDIHTISAGGGSIVWVDEGGGLRVGPRSAGAIPGPACYGLGGTEATVTDANLVLGYLADGALLGGSVRLRRDLAERALAPVADGLHLTLTEVAAGVLTVAAMDVAQALREVSVERGLDPRTFVLVPFGGAGAMHACAVAEELEIPRLLVPLAGGMLSAYGLASSEPRADAVRSIIGLDQNEVQLEQLFRSLECELHARIPDATFTRQLDVRYRGQSHQLTVEARSFHNVRERFDVMHRRRYGYAMTEADMDIVNVRVTARAVRRRDDQPFASFDKARSCADRLAWFDGEERPVRVWAAGVDATPSNGPLIVELHGSTCVVAPGWRVTRVTAGALHLERER